MVEELDRRVAFFFCLITCGKVVLWLLLGGIVARPGSCPVALQRVTKDSQQGTFRGYSLCPPPRLWMPLPIHSVFFEVKWSVCCTDFTPSLAERARALGCAVAAQAVAKKCLPDVYCGSFKGLLRVCGGSLYLSSSIAKKFLYRCIYYLEFAVIGSLEVRLCFIIDFSCFYI